MNNKLSHRENYLRTVHFTKPDFIPGWVGCRTDCWDRHSTALNDLYQEYFNYRPMVDDQIPHPDPKLIDKDGAYHHHWTDEWGCEMGERVFGIHPIIIGHPLANWEALRNYIPPAGADLSPASLEKGKKEVSAAKESSVVMQHFLRVFERMQWVRGYDNLMLDFGEEREELHKLAEMIVEYNLSYINYSIAVGADGVGFSDDWGTQQALMINPAQWRSFFKPYYARMFAPIKKAGMQVHFHSDGYIMDIIPDLKEIGADTINPQTNCHDLEALGKLCLDLRLCVSADIDRQGALSFGTPAEVKNYFDEVAYYLGSHDGGLMFSCECGSETPLENIEAAMQVVRDYQERLLAEVPKRW